MATTGTLHVYFPLSETVDIEEKVTLEDFFTSDKAEHWQVTTDCGAAKAKANGQSFVMFIPDKLNCHLFNGGCYYFIMRCLNR